VSATVEQEQTYRALFAKEEEKRKGVVLRPLEDTMGKYTGNTHGPRVSGCFSIR
jgi:hypothetical protein